VQGDAFARDAEFAAREERAAWRIERSPARIRETRELFQSRKIRRSFPSNGGDNARRVPEQKDYSGGVEAGALRNRVKGNNVKASARTRAKHTHIHTRMHTDTICDHRRIFVEKKIVIAKARFVQAQPRADKIARESIERSDKTFARSTKKERERERVCVVSSLIHVSGDCRTELLWMWI